MFISKKNYDKKLETVNTLNIDLSKQFLEMLERLRINNLNLASVGNSISAGYSKCDKILPFVMRSNIYQLSDNINYYSYARVRRNEDKNILRWYNENISQKDITTLNIDDIYIKKDTYVEKHWDDQTLKNYENLANKDNIGLKDFNCLDNSIMIYNGFTGEFTNALRKGTIQEKLKVMECFKRDFANARIVFAQIFHDNPNTQLYVCGLPNAMGTGIISTLDKYIKDLCDEFPNTIYLPGVIRNVFFQLEGQKTFDIHYSQPEYIQLWNNITKIMIDNYVSTNFKIQLLTKLKEYSLQIEYQSTISKGDEKEIFAIIDSIVEEYRRSFEKVGQDITQSKDDLIRYYKQNYLSTFSCTPKQKVIEKLRNIKS